MNRDFDVCSANRGLLHECLMARNATVNVCALGRLSVLEVTPVLGRLFPSPDHSKQGAQMALSSAPGAYLWLFQVI